MHFVQERCGFISVNVTHFSDHSTDWQARLVWILTHPNKSHVPLLNDRINCTHSNQPPYSQLWVDVFSLCHIILLGEE